MKYTIQINQLAIIENGFNIKGTTLDTWALLDFLVFFNSTKNHKTLNKDGIIYLWINYNYIQENMPLSNFYKQAIKKHLDLLQEVGLIKLIKDEANNIYFTFTELIEHLFISNKNFTELGKNLHTPKENFTQPLGKILPTININNKELNNNNNINNNLDLEKEKNIIKKEKDFESFENVEVVENIKANNEVVSISNELAFNSYEVVETPRINKNLVLWQSEEDKLLEKEFDLFYSLYPRKISKMNAKSAFKKLRLGQHKNFRKKQIPLDNILLALSNLIKQIGRNGTKIEYIPYPASWLNSSDFLSVTDDETILLPQDNETCLNEIKEMLKKMAEVMNEKFKENPQFKEMPEYKIIRREILTKCILNIKDICNKYNVCFYKYYGFCDDDTSEFKRYKWYLEKSFSDWIKESINI